MDTLFRSSKCRWKITFCVLTKEMTSWSLWVQKFNTWWRIFKDRVKNYDWFSCSVFKLQARKLFQLDRSVRKVNAWPINCPRYHNFTAIVNIILLVSVFQTVWITLTASDIDSKIYKSKMNNSNKFIPSQYVFQSKLFRCNLSQFCCYPLFVLKLNKSSSLF